MGRAYSDLARETDPEKRQDMLQYIQGLNDMAVGLKQAASGQEIDTAEVAKLPRRGVPAVGMPPVIQRAPAGVPAQTGGNPPPMSGMPNAGEQTEARRAAMDLSAVEQEYANTKDPAKRQILAEQIRKERDYAAQVGVKAPAAPPGRVVIYKDGKPAGSVPQAQADAAVKQGYTLK